MYISLLGKNKLGFLDGTCVKVNFESSLYHVQEKCNAFVFAWIMNSVSREVINRIVYSTSAFQVWKDLRERFNKVNESRIFQLQRDICIAQQGDQTISEFFFQTPSDVG